MHIGSTTIEAQIRRDTLAVIAASLQMFKGAEEGLFFGQDAPELVVAAAGLLPETVVTSAGGAPTFCSAQMAGDGENVGLRVSVSLAPGEGPLEAPVVQPDSVLVAPGSPRDFLRTVPSVSVRNAAFYIDRDVAFVSLSGSCYLRPMRGLMQTVLEDGRRVSISSSGVTFELRHESTGWMVTNTLGHWIT